MSLIEKYDISEAGLHPFLIQDSWQLSKQNYDEAYHINSLTHFIKHRNSDRVISLLQGMAALITDVNDDDKSIFDIKLMKRGNSYNVPKNTNYAIIMEKGCELFSIETPNTHNDDLIRYNLNEEQLKNIQKNINEEFKNKDE